MCPDTTDLAKYQQEFMKIMQTYVQMANFCGKEQKICKKVAKTGV
jgi:hypothetical protein